MLLDAAGLGFSFKMPIFRVISCDVSGECPCKLDVHSYLATPAGSQSNQTKIREDRINESNSEEAEEVIFRIHRIV